MASRSRSIRCRPRRSRRRPSSSTSLTSSSTIRFRTTCASSSSLHRMMQIEPWLDRDRAMIDLLKSIGIEKGKPFTPDECTKAILTDAASDAHALPRCALRGSLRAAIRCQRTLGVAGVERAGCGSADELCRSQLVSDGRPRTRLQLRLFQRQAPRRRPVLSDDDQGQGRQPDRRGEDLSTPCAAESTGQAVLVGDGLRPGHARADSRHEMVQPFLENAGAAKERRRIVRRVFRAQGARGEGIELGTDKCQRWD